MAPNVFAIISNFAINYIPDFFYILDYFPRKYSYKNLEPKGENIDKVCVFFFIVVIALKKVQNVFSIQQCKNKPILELPRHIGHTMKN